MNDIKELIDDIFEDSSDRLDYHFRIFGILHEECANRKIKFLGYFDDEFKKFCEYPSSYPEEFLENSLRQQLYVYCSALVNEEIYDLLNYAMKKISKKISKEILCVSINMQGNANIIFIRENNNVPLNNLN